MGMFINTMYKEIKVVFKDNVYLKPRLEFLGKYRHDKDYIESVCKKLNKDKKVLYMDCINFIIRLKKFINDNINEFLDDILSKTHVRESEMGYYTKLYREQLYKKIHEWLEKEGEFK